MNKSLFLGLCILFLLFCVSFSTAACEDTDDGVDYINRGITTKGSSFCVDYCKNAYIIGECFCGKDGNIHVTFSNYLQSCGVYPCVDVPLYCYNGGISEYYRPEGPIYPEGYFYGIIYTDENYGETYEIAESISLVDSGMGSEDDSDPNQGDDNDSGNWEDADGDPFTSFGGLVPWINRRWDNMPNFFKDPIGWIIQAINNIGDIINDLLHYLPWVIALILLILLAPYFLPSIIAIIKSLLRK